MARSMGVSMETAALYAIRDGVQRPSKDSISSQIYFDDGKKITTTFRTFCSEIDNNVLLFQERQTDGIKMLPAYQFNLVAGGKGQAATEILATITPLSPKDTPQHTYHVTTNDGSGLKQVVELGEPVLLVRNKVPFAIMCPADKYVWDKIKSDFMAEPAVV